MNCEKGAGKKRQESARARAPVQGRTPEAALAQEPEGRTPAPQNHASEQPAHLNPRTLPAPSKQSATNLPTRSLHPAIRQAIRVVHLAIHFVRNLAKRRALRAYYEGRTW